MEYGIVMDAAFRLCLYVCEVKSSTVGSATSINRIGKIGRNNSALNTEQVPLKKDIKLKPHKRDGLKEHIQHTHMHIIHISIYYAYTHAGK